MWRVFLPDLSISEGDTFDEADNYPENTYIYYTKTEDWFYSHSGAWFTCEVFEVPQHIQALNLIL